MDNSGLHSYERYCVVRSGASWFAVSALSLREIVLPDCFVPLPGAPPAVAGLCHQRNEFLVVLRLDALAGDPPSANDRRQLLVLSGPQGTWGLFVDEVAGLATLDVSVASEPTRTASWTAAVLGCATHNDRVVRVLDSNSLYRFAERSLAESNVGALPADWGADRSANSSEKGALA